MLRASAHAIALVTIFAVLLATLPCFTSEAEACGDGDIAAQVVDGDADGCPTPEPCTDDCRCLCGSGQGFVAERIPNPSRPTDAAAESTHGFVSAMLPGDYVDRIFRPPLSA